MLKFELNVEERKTLAKRMEELTGIHPYYTKAPRYAYDIGNYTIDRDGNLLVEAENADLELLTTLMNEGLIRGGEDVDAETLQETADEQPAVDFAEGVQMIPAVHPNEQETCEGDSEEAEEDGEWRVQSKSHRKKARNSLWQRKQSLWMRIFLFQSASITAYRFATWSI